MTQIINPATLIVIAEPVDTPVEAIHDIVGRARKAQREWGPLTQTHRINALRHIADLVRANLEDIAQLETANVGDVFDVLPGRDQPLGSPGGAKSLEFIDARP